MTRNLSNLLIKAFDLPEVTVLAARIDSDGCLDASFMSGGHFCAVEEVSRGKIQMVRVDAATAEIQGYALGTAEAMGIRLDSDDPWGALAGYLRLDMKCSPGNKPCGQRCIPQQQNCDIGGGRMANAKQGVYSSGRSAIREGIDRAKTEIATGRARTQSRKEQGARAIDEEHKMIDETVREIGKSNDQIQRTKDGDLTTENLLTGQSDTLRGKALERFKKGSQRSYDRTAKQVRGYKKASRVGQKIGNTIVNVEEGALTAGRVANVAGSTLKNALSRKRKRDEN